MNGLGFNRFAAVYLSGIKTDGSGTLPSVTTPWVINKFSANWFDIATKYGTDKNPGNAYPFIGGTAIAHSKDLFLRKDLTWMGTVTHNASGIQGNGVDGAGILGLSRDIFPDQNKYSMGFYCNTNVSIDGKYDMGNQGPGQIIINARQVSGACTVYQAGVSSLPAPAVASSLGLFWLRRDSAAVSYSFYNAAVTGSSTATPTGSAPSNTYICSIQSTTYFTTRRYGFAFVTREIMDQAEVYPAIQALQVHCGRAV